MFKEKTLVSSGSGFFIHSNGTILTNAHVVSDMAVDSALVVTLANGIKLKGRVHSLDLLADLAIVQLEEIPKGIKPVTFGTNANTRPGEFVVAIGCPYGLQNTVTSGVISSRRRQSTEIGALDSRVEYIQTDCVVHSGSSGGPLINLDGQVIGIHVNLGINTTRAESEGISFAIRVDNALGMIKQLVQHGKIIRPYLGIKMTTLSPFVWQQLHAKGSSHIPRVPMGVLVTEVLPDSPAKKAGFLPGDVIVGVQGQLITSSQELFKQVGFVVDQAIILDIKRNCPLEQDWDGRVVRYETIDEHIKVTPRELDYFLSNQTEVLM